MLTVKLFHVILSLCLYGDKRFEIIEKAMNRAGANARLGNTDYPLSTLKVHSTKTEPERCRGYVGKFMVSRSTFANCAHGYQIRS